MTQPPPDLTALLSAVRDFVDGDAPFGEWRGGETRDGVMTLPWFDLSPEALAFWRAAHDGNWIRPDANWTEWMGTEQGWRMQTDPAAQASADIPDIARLLTTLVRGDRFCDGMLAGAHADGTIRRVLGRIAVLAADR